MDKATRESVIGRAGGVCEYCRLPQLYFPAPFHVDHIIATQHLDNPGDSIDLLAYACGPCNLRKGTNLTSIDPLNQQITTLYNPRSQDWESHFRFKGAIIVGLTACGRATTRLLQMNDEIRVKLRMWLIVESQIDSH